MKQHVLDVLFWEWAPLLILVGIGLWVALITAAGIEIFDWFRAPKSRQGDEEDQFEERFNL